MFKFKKLLIAAAASQIVVPISAQNVSEAMNEIADQVQEQIKKNAVEEVGPGLYRYHSDFELIATVTALNLETREVQLQGPQGNYLTITAGPDVRNLKQVQLGDQVIVEYEETLEIALQKRGPGLAGGAQVALAERAELGDLPGMEVAQQDEVIVRIVGLNSSNQIVTLKGPNRYWELPIADPEQFELLNIGDTATVVASKALAISVEPAS